MTAQSRMQPVLRTVVERRERLALLGYGTLIALVVAIAALASRSLGLV